MTKTISGLFFISLFTYLSISPSSCAIQEENSLIKKHNYEEIQELIIPYSNLLKMEDFEYFAYIYSDNCLYCETIKNEIIEFALLGRYPLYFIPYTKDIPLLTNVDDTINKNTLDHIGILGTPSLIQIIDGYIKLNVSGQEIILSIIKQY